MMKQVSIRESVGKTLRAVGGQECGEVLILIWDDGTFSAVRGRSIDNNYDWKDFEISLEPSPYGSQLWWPAKLVELGIVTDAEVKESDIKVQAATAKRHEEQERQRYEELRRKYETPISY